MTAQRVERRENVCDVCGLPGVQHGNTAGCVSALREECDRLRSRLGERLDNECGDAIGSRQICGFTGFCLVTVGAAFSLAKTFAHLAVALPLSELPMQAGFLGGLAAVLAGALLLAVAYSSVFRGAPTRRSPDAAVPGKKVDASSTMPSPRLAA